LGRKEGGGGRAGGYVKNEHFAHKKEGEGNEHSHARRRVKEMSARHTAKKTRGTSNKKRVRRRESSYTLRNEHATSK
jgi:hypothetical protein